MPLTDTHSVSVPGKEDTSSFLSENTGRGLLCSPETLVYTDLPEAYSAGPSGSLPREPSDYKPLGEHSGPESSHSHFGETEAQSK